MYLKGVWAVTPEIYWTWPLSLVLTHTALCPRCCHPKPSPLHTVSNGATRARMSTVFVGIMDLQGWGCELIQRRRLWKCIPEETTGMWCFSEVSGSFYVYMRAQLLQSWPTLWDPMDCNPPGSSVHGILQARILEWVAMSSSRGSSWCRDWICDSCSSFIADSFFTTEPPGKPWQFL